MRLDSPLYLIREWGEYFGIVPNLLELIKLSKKALPAKLLDSSRSAGRTDVCRVVEVDYLVFIRPQLVGRPKL